MEPGKGLGWEPGLERGMASNRVLALGLAQELGKAGSNQNRPWSPWSPSCQLCLQMGKDIGKGMGKGMGKAGVPVVAVVVGEEGEGGSTKDLHCRSSCNLQLTQHR